MRSSYYVIIIEIKKKFKKEYLVFATNNPRIDVEKYRKRWVIETGYRDINDMRLKTSSYDHRVRELMFIFSVLFYNAWILARNIQCEDDLFDYCNQITALVFLEMTYEYIKSFIDPEIEPEPPPKPAVAC